MITYVRNVAALSISFLVILLFVLFFQREDLFAQMNDLGKADVILFSIGMSAAIALFAALFAALGLLCLRGIRKTLEKKFPEKKLPEVTTPLNLLANKREWITTVLTSCAAVTAARFFFDFADLPGDNIMVFLIFGFSLPPLVAAMLFVGMPWFRKQLVARGS